jgi:tRNA modification GTPase
MIYDTIAAIATPIGEGSIGIVRISGDDAFAIVNSIFKSPRGEKWFKGSHRLYYGHVVDEKDGRIVDEVLISVMKAPHTYTREDVAEINCHGGIVPLLEILKLVLAHGARQALPGEFTKRAFLNGRIDLSQAESVIDIIRAKTGLSLNLAVNQLQGKLSEKILQIWNQIMGMLAELEAAIDFPEDEVEEKSIMEMINTAELVKNQLAELINSAESGRIYREGLRTVIAGRPNVGKSSLLNALLRENRAIVTEVPGTTRDVIEEMLSIRGIPLILIDTAGIRKTEDIVERIGVGKAKESLAAADMVLLVIDVISGFTDEDREIARLYKDKKIIVILNKIDLNGDIFIGVNDLPVVNISAKTGAGLSLLEDKIEELALQGITGISGDVAVSNVRHQMAIKEARQHVEDFIAAIENDLPPDLSSLELRLSLECLGEITGSTVTEDLLDRIFKDFCIGK